MRRKLLALLLALGFLTAAAAPAGAVAPWALDGLCEAESLELLTAGDMEVLEQPLSHEKLQAICRGVSAKLDRLRDPVAHTPLARAGDVTRGGVLSALYDAAYAFDTRRLGPLNFLAQTGVVQGDQNGQYHLDRTCTLQEALLFAQRLVLNLYDQEQAGTRGLLWKAEKGSNTLYLFGTYHVDRGDLYPLHRSVRGALGESGSLCLEVDFGDAAGAAAFQSACRYPQGDSLKNHLPAATYRAVVDAFAQAGYAEQTAAALKPWAAATTLEGFAYADETTGASVMTCDTYLYSKAVCGGKSIGQVESYALQAGVLDGLSEATQTAMVDNALALLAEEGEADSLFAPWQTGDEAAFTRLYAKDAPTRGAAEAELLQALFTDRDPGMTAWCVDFLEKPGVHTATFAVGAGHLVGDTGVVASLRALGYTVEPISN